VSDEPNLRLLRPSRTKLRPGDLFALSPLDDLFLFGRVISTEATVGPISGLNLIYIYNVKRTSADPPHRDTLTADRLLVPPMMINRLPWSRGYFTNVAHDDPTTVHMLPQHCFRDSRGRYWDEHGAELPGAVEPVGERGVHSFRTCDDAVSDALGIARA
jgi:immunity protein 26 of polymorphic toxin system